MSIVFPVRPMLAQLHPSPADELERYYPFNRPGWVYEPKYDGHRLVTRVTTAGAVIMWSRSGREVTHEYPEVVEAVKDMVGSVPAVYDGEVVAYFDGMQRPAYLGVHKRKLPGVHLRYHVFDVLALGPDDLTALPYEERRRRLEELFDWTVPDRRVFPTIATANGPALWRATLQVEGEGIIAKPANSRYIVGERGTWLKIKANRQEPFFIVGYTAGERSRAPLFGALILARRSSSSPYPFVYAGKCGTGFNDAESEDMMTLFSKYATSEPPFPRESLAAAKQKIGPRAVTWLRPDPELLCWVEYSDLSEDGIPSFPSFKGFVR